MRGRFCDEDSTLNTEGEITICENTEGETCQWDIDCDYELWNTEGEEQGMWNTEGEVIVMGLKWCSKGGVLKYKRISS